MTGHSPTRQSMDLDARSPGLEAVEPRLLLSGTAYVVDSLLDLVASDGNLTLREAITAANTNAAVNEAPAGSGSETDTISFAAGLFSSGAAVLTLAGTSLQVSGDLSITGPGATLLSISGANLSRVLQISGNTVDAALSGLRITGGNTSGDGGGVHISDGAAVTFTNCTIASNTAISDGGGVLVLNGATATLIGCTISLNRTMLDHGGGLCVRNAAATLENCVIDGNYTHLNWGFGGGVYIDASGSATLTDCVISGNRAADGGGLAVTSIGAVLTLTGCTLSGNQANDTGGGGLGGGLWVGDTDDVTLENCQITGNTANGNGGGVSLTQQGGAALTGCTLSNNSTLNYGGGLYVEHGSVALTDSFVLLNDVTGNTGQGGGMYAYSSDVTLTVCEFSGNATSGLDGFGGGLSIEYSDAVLTDCLIDANSADTGGGLHGQTSTLSLTGCTISDNTLAGQDSYGGGLYAAYGVLTLSDCTVSGNQIDADLGHGGGLYIVGAQTTLTGCLITENLAPDFGGGIYFTDYRPAVLTDCTISLNMASGHGGRGGGLYMANSDAVLTGCVLTLNLTDGRGGALFVASGGAAVVINSQISLNSAVNNGGGIYIDYGFLTLTNTTIAYNTASTGGGAYVDGDGASLSNTIVALNTASGNIDVYGNYLSQTNLVGIDPLFVRAPSAGGDATWGTPDDDLGDLHLAPGSTAINGGTDSKAVDDQGGPLTTDLDGGPRIIGLHVDIGAYEYDGSPGDFNIDGLVNVQDINAFVQALASPQNYLLQHPGVSIAKLDLNGDGSINVQDINAFVAALADGAVATGMAQSLSLSDTSPVLAAAPAVPQPQASTETTGRADPVSFPAEKHSIQKHGGPSGVWLDPVSSPRPALVARDLLSSRHRTLWDFDLFVQDLAALAI